MIRYVKGPPPGNLTTLAATPQMNWAGLGAADRDPIRAALLRDQGALCAYCQRRITADADPVSGLSQMKIEHWIPRSQPEVRPLVWSHLLGVCLGVSPDFAESAAGRKTAHCDTSRGNHTLFLHPVAGQGPDPTVHLRYAKDGRAEAANQDARVANDIRALNLNARQLVRGRAAVLDAAWKRLARSGFAASELRRLAQAHRIVTGTQVPEHAEFVRYHVVKKLRSLGHAP
jgi:uncharacterized protein (TIGR02646 family)